MAGVHDNDTLIGTSGGGVVRGHRARADWLKLDGVCRTDLDGVVPEAFPIEHLFSFPIHGLIGHELLRGCRLTLDFSGMKLFLE